MKAKRRKNSNLFKICLIFVSILVLCPVSFATANQPPVANVDPDHQTVYVGEEAWFTSNGSYDPDGWIESFDWDFGDGYSSNAANITITHIYCVPGNYTVTLTVTDNENATDTDTVLVTVLGFSGNQPPVAEADPDHQTVYVGEEAWFTGNGSYDPDGATGELLSESQPLMIDPYGGWVEWNAEYNASQGVLYNISGKLTRIDLPLLAEGFDVCGGSGIPGEYLVVLSFSDESGNVLGNTSTIVNTTASGGPPYVSTWYTFKFTTAIPVTTGNLYYISVEAPDESPTKGAYVMWRGIGVEGFDPYPKAHGYFDGVIVDDFTFKTYLAGDGGPSSLTYHWDFGDGTNGSGATVKHIYSAPGNYTVVLTVTDNEGATDNDTVLVTVLESPSGNEPPVADAEPDYQTVYVGEEAWFTGNGSYDPDGWIISFDWDFGDGSYGNGMNVVHVYTVTGNYTVTLTVTDNEDATDTDTVTVTVLSSPSQNQPPVANADPDHQTVHVGEETWFTGNGSYDLDGWIVSFDWDFGDGSYGNGVNVVHIYTVPGNYTVTLTVTDNENATDTDTVTVTVLSSPSRNQPPVADADPDHQTVYVGEEAWFNGYNSYDPDGWIVSYDWDFGDGNSGSGVNISHIYLAPGNYTVTLTVTDNYGATDQDIAWVKVEEPSSEPPGGNETEPPEEGEPVPPEENGTELSGENKTWLSEGNQNSFSKKGENKLSNNYNVLWINLIIILLLVIIISLIFTRRSKEKPQEQNKTQTQITSHKST